MRSGPNYLGFFNVDNDRQFGQGKLRADRFHQFLRVQKDSTLKYQYILNLGTFSQKQCAVTIAWLKMRIGTVNANVLTQDAYQLN